MDTYIAIVSKKRDTNKRTNNNALFTSDSPLHMKYSSPPPPPPASPRPRAPHFPLSAIPSESPTTSNPDFLQPYSVVTKVDGSLELDIDSLIKENEEYQGAPRSHNGFDKKCLNVVHSRLDLTSPKVREAFHAFDQNKSKNGPCTTT